MTIEQQIFNIKMQLPILRDGDNPKSLRLSKLGKPVRWYDPVYDVRIKDGMLEVEGFIHHIYKHRLEEFDALEAVDEEPLEPIALE